MNGEEDFYRCCPLRYARPEVRAERGASNRARPSSRELGYHVTLVKDASAAASAEAMHAAHVINGPAYADAITTTDAPIAEFAG